jgi:hypothetical protein
MGATRAVIGGRQGGSRGTRWDQGDQGESIGIKRIGDWALGGIRGMRVGQRGRGGRVEVEGGQVGVGRGQVGVERGRVEVGRGRVGLGGRGQDRV